MTTTELIRPAAAPGRAASLSDARHNVSTSASEDSTFGDVLAETIPLAGAIAGYGPPVIFLAGPWLLLALLLSAPFAVLLTLVVAMVVAAAVLAAVTAAVLGAPYLLIRGLRSYRERRALSNDRRPQLVPVASTRVAA